MNGKQIALLVYSKRKRDGLSLEQAAEIIGLALTTLARIERGESCPDFYNLLSVARWLGVPIDYICTETDYVIEFEDSTPGRIEAALFTDRALSIGAALQLSNTIRAVYRLYTENT